MDTKARPIYMLSTRNPFQTYVKTESEGVEKYISCKWQSKENQSSNSRIRQNHLSFLNKDVLSSFALAEDNQCDISENTGCFEPQQKSFPP